MKTKKFKINSFFAGIGGFDLAFEQAGFESAFQCEINNFCLRILEQHWPNVPRSKDIKTLKSNEIPVADIWCGGFPCQDVSVARGAKGRMGLKGENSGLFYPFIDQIEKAMPSVVLLENVTGLLSSHNGQDFRVILEKFTKLGYAVSWRVLNSRYFGAPQSRPRVFICASLQNPNLALEALFETTKSALAKNVRQGFLNVHSCEVSGAKVAEVAYCLAATSGRHTGTDWSRTYVSYDSAVRRMTPRECEGVQGFPKEWTLPVKINDKNEDIDSERYHALGNAVAVPVVKWIAQRLLKALKQGKDQSTKNDDYLLYDMSLKYPDFEKDKVRQQNLSDLHLNIDGIARKLKWHSGGFAYGDHCFDLKVSDSPVVPILSNLISVIEKEIVADKYFISSNAAEGILRRVNGQNRTLFGPLNEALVKLSKKKNVA